LDDAKERHEGEPRTYAFPLRFGKCQRQMSLMFESSSVSIGGFYRTPENKRDRMPEQPVPGSRLKAEQPYILPNTNLPH
jgi:hypothetical protein